MTQSTYSKENHYILWIQSIHQKVPKSDIQSEFYVKNYPNFEIPQPILPYLPYSHLLDIVGSGNGSSISTEFVSTLDWLYPPATTILLKSESGSWKTAHEKKYLPSCNDGPFFNSKFLVGSAIHTWYHTRVYVLGLLLYVYPYLLFTLVFNCLPLICKLKFRPLEILVFHNRAHFNGY